MTQASDASASAYYKGRATCRKIMREGTGLQVQAMSDRQLMLRLNSHAELLRAWIEETDVSQPPIVRAAWEISEISNEIFLRGHQLEMS